MAIKRKIRAVARRRRFPVFLVPALLAASFFLAVPVSRAQESVVRLDPAQTRIEFSLDGNMHTVHGKFALKSSNLRFDPSTGKIAGSIIVDATSGDTGNGSRDKKMHREILESDKFPEIVFTPAQMNGKFTPDAAGRIDVSGKFRLHGQDHEVTLPIEWKPDGQNLQISSHMDVPYVKWGLKNPSNFLLRVGDTVAIEIHAAGRFENSAAAR